MRSRVRARRIVEVLARAHASGAAPLPEHRVFVERRHALPPVAHSSAGDDESAAEHARARLRGVVNHARLPGRNADFGLEEGDAPVGKNRAGAGGRVERTRAATGNPSSGKSANAPGPIQLKSRNLSRVTPAAARADDHARLRRVERDHIERLGRGDAEAAPLADRIMQDAGMAPEHAAVDMDDSPGSAAPGNSRSIISL